MFYLSKLPRFEKKVRVALDWTLDLLFSKDLVQFMEVCMRVERLTLIEAVTEGSESRAA